MHLLDRKIAVLLNVNLRVEKSNDMPLIVFRVFDHWKETSSYSTNSKNWKCFEWTLRSYTFN